MEITLALTCSLFTGFRHIFGEGLSHYALIGFVCIFQYTQYIVCWYLVNISIISGLDVERGVYLSKKI